MKITTKIMSAMLSVMLIVSCIPTTFATEEANVGLTARFNNSAVLVDGIAVSFEAYNIKDNNYVKLRDLAQVISGTEKQFEVGWDEKAGSIALTSGEAYTAIGGEMQLGDGEDKVATTGTSDIKKDGENVSLTAYLVHDNNYFKLRDLGQLFDFEVAWDGAAGIVIIDTAKSYTGANASAKDYITFYENYSDVPDMGAMLNLPLFTDLIDGEGTIDERQVYYYEFDDLNAVKSTLYSYENLLFGCGFYYTKSTQYDNVDIFLSKAGRYLTVEWYKGDEDSGIPSGIPYVVGVLIDTQLIPAEFLAEINFPD